METPANLGQHWFWPLPVWFWPPLVCAGAWLFRRWMLRGETLMPGRAGPIGPGWMVSARKATPPGATMPLRSGGWMADGLLRRLTVSLAGLWHCTGSRNMATDQIAVLGRRMVGPQQQVLVIRAGDEEHTLLLQGGGPALLLSTRAVKASGPRAPAKRREFRGRTVTGTLPPVAHRRRVRR
jgi:hypothetical protein